MSHRFYLITTVPNPQDGTQALCEGWGVDQTNDGLSQPYRINSNFASSLVDAVARRVVEVTTTNHEGNVHAWLLDGRNDLERIKNGSFQELIGREEDPYIIDLFKSNKYSGKAILFVVCSGNFNDLLESDTNIKGNIKGIVILNSGENNVICNGAFQGIDVPHQCISIDRLLRCSDRGDSGYPVVLALGPWAVFTAVHANTNNIPIQAITTGGVAKRFGLFVKVLNRNVRSSFLRITDYGENGQHIMIQDDQSLYVHMQILPRRVKILKYTLDLIEKLGSIPGLGNKLNTVTISLLRKILPAFDVIYLGYNLHKIVPNVVLESVFRIKDLSPYDSVPSTH